VQGIVISLIPLGPAKKNLPSFELRTVNFCAEIPIFLVDVFRKIFLLVEKDASEMFLSSAIRTFLLIILKGGYHLGCNDESLGFTAKEAVSVVESNAELKSISTVVLSLTADKLFTASVAVT
jgi:hypothetical protein